LEIVFGPIVYCVNAVVLASYLAAFLTPKRGNRLWAAIGMGVAYIVLQAAIDFIIAHNVISSALQSFRQGLIGILLFLISLTLYRREMGKQAFLLCSFFAVFRISVFINVLLGEVLVFPLSSLLTQIVFSNPAALPSDVEAVSRIVAVLGLLPPVLLHAACLSLSLYSVSKSFVYKKQGLRHGEALSLILTCLPVFVVSNAVLVLGGQTVADLISRDRNFQLFTSLLSVLLLLTMIVSVKQQQKNARLSLEAKDSAILREQVKQLQSQDESGVYAEIRGMRHDMKNHLANMRLLMKPSSNGEAETLPELGAYLDRMSETLEHLDFAYKTGNSVSDVVIHQAYLEATRNHIRFTSEFLYPSTLEIDASDLAVILQNALENAVEACKTVPEEHRFIEISSYQKGYIYFVEVSNSYAGNVTLDPLTELPPTSKPDASAHGLGLANIRRAARKRQGDIAIQLTEKDGASIFRLTVMLQGETK
jgi:sensor histidine kinase regulating citrate/malate metabolism